MFRRQFGGALRLLFRQIPLFLRSVELGQRQMQLAFGLSACCGIGHLRHRRFQRGGGAFGIAARHLCLGKRGVERNKTRKLANSVGENAFGLFELAVARQNSAERVGDFGIGDRRFGGLREPFFGVRRLFERASRQNSRSTEATRIHLTWQDRQVNVNMVVRPLQHPQAGRQWMLVVFIEADSMPTAAAEAATGESDPSEAGELLQARRDLQRSVERSQTSAEELRAATRSCSR